jgi:serine/threonine protein kinase
MPESKCRYRLLRKLGAGGMGEVFLAEDTRLGRQVALKLLAPELAKDEMHRRRFVREARSASALSHPNVCVIHEVGELDDGRPFIAMEFIEGLTLETRIEGGPIPIEEAVSIIVQVADALEAAHSRGIVHRDIKPANISVDARGQVKVLDFGLAKWMGVDGAGAGQTTSLTTAPGTLLGTPAFMSPEQALGRPLDERSDIFSFGAVLYQLLTGRLPFPGDSFAEVASKLVQGRYEAIARFNYDVPAELERITRKCLAKEPENRFQSARELCLDLKRLKQDLAAGGSPSGVAAASDGLQRLETVHVPPRETDAAGAAVSVPAESDVLITYAKLDDQPLASGKQGWISEFYRNLELRVAQLSGRKVQVWKVGDPPEGAPAERTSEAKTCVSIVSPPFVRSRGCRRLVEAFWRRAESAGRFEVNKRSRILNVVKTPVEPAEVPPDLQPLFSRLIPYEFFDRDPQSGRIREFDEAFGELARQRFHERVYDVAFDISQILKILGAPLGSSQTEGAARKRIFLAATTSDLEPQRDQLRRELAEQGFETLPRQPLPLVASEIITVVRSCLEECDLAIHLVGEHYGFVPEATELSVVALQNQVAAEGSARSGLGRLIWMPKGLEPRDARQAAFVRDLERDPVLHRGADVVVDSLENLKVILQSRWDRQAKAAQRPRPSAGPDAPPRVYLICDRQDEAAVEPLEDFFYEGGIEVSLPGFDASESEVQEIHIQHLRDCDGAMIYYGAAGMHWVDFNIRDLQKAAGYRNAEPIAVQAVYIAPPFHRRKERFRSLTAEVITQAGEAFHPAALEGFVQALQAQRGKKP